MHFKCELMIKKNQLHFENGLERTHYHLMEGQLTLLCSSLFLGGMGSTEAWPGRPGQGGVSSHITMKPSEASTTVEENTTL
jgi:hypothetical protein